MSNTFSKKSDKKFCCALTLDKAKLNVPYTITSCSLPDKLKTRFAELGFVAGATVTVIKRAPLSDPLEINIKGYSLCVRANELKYFTAVCLNE